jgi:hypothetical protein
VHLEFEDARHCRISEGTYKVRGVWADALERFAVEGLAGEFGVLDCYRVGDVCEMSVDVRMAGLVGIYILSFRLLSRSLLKSSVVVLIALPQ